MISQSRTKTIRKSYKITWLCLFLLRYPHNPGLRAREKTYINSLVPSPSLQATNHAVATAGTNDDRFNRPKANAPWQQQDSKLQAVPGADQHCTAGRQDPVKGFYFVKVAKTGTTTICSMMTRFIRLNNLSVLTPVKGYAVQWWKERNIGQSFSSLPSYPAWQLYRKLKPGFNTLNICLSANEWSSWVLDCLGIKVLRLLRMP